MDGEKGIQVIYLIILASDYHVSRIACIAEENMKQKLTFIQFMNLSIFQKRIC